MKGICSKKGVIVYKEKGVQMADMAQTWPIQAISASQDSFRVFEQLHTVKTVAERQDNYRQIQTVKTTA